jgi:ornithine carbamoyltransferase
MNERTSFLKLTDISIPQLESLLEAARGFKVERLDNSSKPLGGQTWALLFHKASTRTRVSFEVGIHELGGHAMVLDQNRLQTGRGESIEDTAKVLSRYIHGIVIRTYEQAYVEDFARYGSIPVVNALTDALHPCQVLSDLFTLAERWGRPGALLKSLRGRKVAFFGDCASNMAHSWILGAAMAGMELVLCGPERFAPRGLVDERLREAGLAATHRFIQDPGEAARDADALYTDVWVSMGDEAERENRIALLSPYQVDGKLMELARPEALFLHCLPAHVGEEVSESVYHGPGSIVFDQAENRLHAQKAILSLLSQSTTTSSTGGESS